MSNADLGSLDFTLHIDDKEFNKSVAAATQKAQKLNTDLSTLLDIRKKYNSVSKDDVTNARNTNRILREENKTREMNRREIIRTRKELVKLNAEKARANGVSNGGSLAAQQSMLSNMTNLAMKYVSIWGASSLIKNIANVTAEFELQRIALQAMIADTQKANQVYNQIWDLALKSPFNAKELVTYAKQLVAYSIPVNELFETTKMLADVSAGLGVGMDRLVLAYGQIRSASFLRGQEVRQLTEAGIPILEELRKQFVELGEETITVGDVFDKISKRLVPFEMVEKVFKNMTSEGGKFYQMQEIQAETLKGKIMILKDAYDKMFNAIGEKNRSTIKNAIDWATNLARNYEKTMGVLKSLIAAYGAYKVALELAILGERGFLAAATIKKITETATRMKALTGSAQTFAVVMRNVGEANVKKAFASLAGAIALVATALIVAIRNAGELKRELDGIASAKFTEASRSVEDFSKLADRLQKATVGSQKYRDAISQLNNKYGDYLPNLLNEKNALDEIAKSYDRVTNAIYSQAKAYAYEEGVRKLEEKTGVKLTDSMASIVTSLVGKGVDKEAAQIFARNFKDALADSDQWTSSFDVFLKTWKEVMGDISNPFEDYMEYQKGFQFVVNNLEIAAKKYKEAEEGLNAALEARFGGEGYSTALEAEKVKPVEIAYAQTREEILNKQLSAEETENELLKAKKERLSNLISVYNELNVAAAEAGKVGLWDNQIKRYVNELKSLEEPDLSWLQKIVNPLVDDKNRDLRPQNTDQYEEYIDNLRNVYKKQVGLVDDLTDTYNKYLDARRRGIKDEDNAYTKSKDLYLLEKKRKEVIEAIGKALGISVDDKVNKGSGKSDEQLKLETQIATLKDLEKWYGKLKDLGMGDDDIRSTLKNFFLDAEILNTSRSFRDELMKLAKELEKFDKKAAQALRDDISGYGLDDLVDRLKNAIDASKKLEKTLKGLKDETTLEGTGAAFDISKIVHDYVKAMRDIGDKRDEVWKEAYDSFEKGNFVDVGELLKVTGDWEHTQGANSLAKAINAIDEVADQWVKDWAKMKGVNLDDWADMTIPQLKAVRNALEGLFDDNGDLIEGADDRLASIKDSLSQIPGGWEAFVNAIKKVVGKDDFEGEGLLGKLSEMTTKEKIQLIKYAAKSIVSLSDSLIKLGDAAGNNELRTVGGMIRDVSSLATDIAEGYAIGGWFGATIGALKNIGTAILENAAAAEIQNRALEHTANVTSKLFQWDKNIELASGNIFGKDELATLRETVKSIAALNDQYSRLAWRVNDAKNSLMGLSDSVKKSIENIELTTFNDSKGAFGWLTKFFTEKGYTNIKALADQLGYSLYDEYGYVNAEFLRQVLTLYSDDLNAAEKDWLNSAIEYSEKATEYIEKIRDTMESLVGSVADTFADNIVDQWVEAGDAAAGYIDILDDVARAYAKMMVKDVLMKTIFTDDLNKQLTEATISGDSAKALTLLDNAMSKVEALGPTITPILDGLSKWFQSADTSTLGQGIKGVTEDTASLLASYINGIRGDLASQKEVVEKIASSFESFWKATYHTSLDEYLHNIEANTADTARDTNHILTELRSVITTENGPASIRVAD